MKHAPLPTLDGSVEASVARLDAWLKRERPDTVNDALETARESLDELHRVATARRSTEVKVQADELHTDVREALLVIEQVAS